MAKLAGESVTASPDHQGRSEDPLTMAYEELTAERSSPGQ